LERHLPADRDRLDRGREGRFGVVGVSHPATVLDDLWQRHQADALRQGRAAGRAGRTLACCVGGRARPGYDQEGRGQEQ
jgi:hypothetical protein